MKTTASFFAALTFIGTLGAHTTAIDANGILFKQELTPGSYCHLKFPAIHDETLAGDHPVLKDSSDGAIIDFYGECDEDPLGKDQVQEQRLNTSILRSIHRHYLADRHRKKERDHDD